MKFTQLKIFGAYLIDLEKREDERGFFARAFCTEEFAKQGLVTHFPQINMSFNHKRGTIRGLHYQVAPHEETKLMRCIAGEMYDVVVDLRKDSPTYLQWMGITLSAENDQALYIPAGCANGYQALVNGTKAFYAASVAYAPGAEKGICWNDSTLNVVWPITENIVVSEKDSSLPDFLA